MARNMGMRVELYTIFRTVYYIYKGGFTGILKAVLEEIGYHDVRVMGEEINCVAKGDPNFVIKMFMYSER